MSKEQIEKKEKDYMALMKRLVRANLQSESKTAKSMNIWAVNNIT